MITFDKNIFGSNREVDDNGYLRVSDCNITKAQVRPYLGKEIPNWQSFGLVSDNIYGVLCPAEELQKAVGSFNNLPLTRKHIKVDIDNVPSKDIVGSLGDSCVFEYPYLKNSLIVYDKKEIDLIMSGKKKELSCGYTYTPVRESGEFNGEHYDFKMTDIIGNHIALVKQGRAGRDVMVADSSKGLLETIKDKIMAVFDNDLKDNEEDAIMNVEIPAEAGNTQEAGEVALTNGENKMADEVKEVEEVKVEEPVAEQPAETPAEEVAPVEEVPAAQPVGDEKVVEDKCDEKVEEKEKSEKEEEKEEKPAEAKKDKKEEEAKDKCSAEDSAIVMDIDAIKAEAHEAGRQEAIADFNAREVARKAVRKMVGDVDVFAFDSAEEIYKFACEKSGMDCSEVSSFKDAFKGLSCAKVKVVMDAAPISSGNVECFKDIRID